MISIGLVQAVNVQTRGWIAVLGFIIWAFNSKAQAFRDRPYREVALVGHGWGRRGIWCRPPLRNTVAFNNPTYSLSSGSWLNLILGISSKPRLLYSQLACVQ